MQNNVFEIHSCFSSISRSPWSLHGVGSYAKKPYTPVQSKHTFQFSIFFINVFPEGCEWSQIWCLVCCICKDFCEKRILQQMLKKGVPPESNYPLFRCQEAPWQTPSRAHFSNKKQLFEQQFKHCSMLLREKVSWIRCWCCCCCFCCVFVAVIGTFWFSKAGDLTRPGQGPANCWTHF